MWGQGCDELGLAGEVCFFADGMLRMFDFNYQSLTAAKRISCKDKVFMNKTLFIIS